MKTQQELCDILGFIAEYATYQLGSGVHTSRVIRNAQRIGEALGVDVQLSSFQKSTILTVLDTVSGESATRVVAIPSLPISFERNSDLSALSWDALDEGLSLDEIRSRYGPNLHARGRRAGQRLILQALRRRLDGRGHRLHGDTRGLRRQTAHAGPRCQSLPRLRLLGFRRLALRHGSLAVRLHGRDSAGNKSALPRAGRAAHQRGHRHHGRTRPHGGQPAG